RHEVREALGIDIDRPVYVGCRVPLEPLALLVEVEEGGPLDLVVPIEDRVLGLGDRFEATDGREGNVCVRHLSGFAPLACRGNPFSQGATGLSMSARRPRPPR